MERFLGELLIASRLRTVSHEVWEHAIDPRGINAELWPILKMTFPGHRLDLNTTSTPNPARSWLLLGGIIPVEYDDVVIAELESGRRLLERSSTFTQRVWEHERIVEPRGEGCSLTDRIRFVPRAPWLDPVFGFLFRAVFKHRHRRLRGLFGHNPT